MNRCSIQKDYQDYLLKSKIFSTIDICNSLENLSKHLKEEPPEMLVMSSNMLMLSEICKLVETIIAKHKNTKITIIGSSYDVIDIRKLFNKGIKAYLDKIVPMTNFLNPSMFYFLMRSISVIRQRKE